MRSSLSDPNRVLSRGCPGDRLAAHHVLRAKTRLALKSHWPLGCRIRSLALFVECSRLFLRPRFDLVRFRYGAERHVDACAVAAGVIILCSIPARNSGVELRSTQTFRTPRNMARADWQRSISMAMDPLRRSGFSARDAEKQGVEAWQEEKRKRRPGHCAADQRVGPWTEKA